MKEKYIRKLKKKQYYLVKCKFINLFSRGGFVQIGNSNFFYVKIGF